MANRVPLEIVSMMPAMRSHLAKESKKTKSAADLLDKWDDVDDDDAVVFDRSGVKESDWITVELMLPLLEKANEISQALEGSNAVTNSSIVPKLAELLVTAEEQIALLSKPCLDSVDREDARGQALLFAKEFCKQLNKYTSIRECPVEPSIYWLAAYLDPRYRSFLWVPKEKREAARLQVASWLQAEINALPPLFEHEPLPADGGRKRKAGDAAEGEPAAKRGKFEGEDDNDEQMEAQETEVQRWHKLKSIAGQMPLPYLKSLEKDFPGICRVARRILCAPASSAPSERVFSAAELLISALRTSLTSENVSELMSVDRNQRFLPEYAEMLKLEAEEAKVKSSSSSSSSAGAK